MGGVVVARSRTDSRACRKTSLSDDEDNIFSRRGSFKIKAQEAEDFIMARNALLEEQAKQGRTSISYEHCARNHSGRDLPKLRFFPASGKVPPSTEAISPVRVSRKKRQTCRKQFKTKVPSNATVTGDSQEIPELRPLPRPRANIVAKTIGIPEPHSRNFSQCK